MSRSLEGVPAPSLARRMGWSVLRERGDVRYLGLETRSLLNRCDSPRVPFRWTVNPYRGCAMGCCYCYAAYTHEFMGITTPERFHSTVYAKSGGEAETARRLARAVATRELVALGTATDPYQPGEAQFGVTRRFLELAAGFRGLRLAITTKGALLLRDLDLLRRIHERAELTLAVSLVSPHAALLRRLEPWAPPPEVRLELLGRLVAEGLDAGLALAPVLPGITDAEADLDALLAAARRAGVRRMWWNLLFLRSPTREKLLRFLEAEFPRLLPAYRRAYAGRVYLGGSCRRRLGALLERLRAKHGFEPRREHARARRLQLRLWA